MALAIGLAAAGLRADNEGGEEGGGYWALFDNGQEVTGEVIRDWGDREPKANLSGRRLFDPANHVRLLCHTTRRPAGSGPRVYMANGDVLPGRVTAFLPADPAANLPARFCVALAPPLLAGRGERIGEDGKNVGTSVYVRSDAVTKMVLGPQRPRAHRGGAVFLADGRSVAVTAIRWQGDGLKALAQTEIIAGQWGELAEVHIPNTEPMQAVLADAIVPTMAADQWVGRMQTEEGGMFTYRMAACETRRIRGSRLYDYHHAIQPLWALTPFQVPEMSICLRSYRRAMEVPLSLLPAETLAERSFTGFLWPWQRNANVRGEILRCGGMFCDLGFGTHSYSEVAFELPPGARSFACYVGLDRAVAAGGCARCEIRQDDPGGKSLWKSNLLIGSTQPARVGPLSVEKAKRLVFLTDFAHDDRPADADPGDIRDEVDWLLPLVSLDAAAGRLTQRDLWRHLPALDGWILAEEQIRGLSLGLATAGRDPAWQFTVDVPSAGLTVSRKIRVSAASTLLQVAVARANDDMAHSVEVLANGKLIEPSLPDRKPLTTRDREAGQVAWQRWNLMEFAGQEATVSVRLRPHKDQPDGRSLILRGLGFLPLIANLPAGGKPFKPDVPLTSLEPVSVIWHPQDKNKKPEKTALPEPGPRKVFGLELPDAYAISAGMRMTYGVRPSFRRFVAVVGSENPYHRGPFTVLLDGKEVWRSGEAVDGGQLQQAVVDIPPGTRTVCLMPEHNMTTGVWACAGFLTR